MNPSAFILFIFIIILPVIATAQNKYTSKDQSTQAQNGWYIELAGSSLIGLTANYERFLSKKPGGFSIHAGFGGAFLFGFGESGGFGAIPTGLSYNIPISKDHKNFIEVGGNYTYLFGSGTGESILSPIVSWRYIVAPKGLQLRATLIPFLFLQSESSAIGPWFGFSIGTRF